MNAEQQWRGLTHLYRNTAPPALPEAGEYVDFRSAASGVDQMAIPLSGPGRAGA